MHLYAKAVRNRLPYRSHILALLPNTGISLLCMHLGGRIFYPGSHLPTACPIKEDEGWRLLQEAAGPVDQDAVEPQNRKVCICAVGAGCMAHMGMYDVW